MKEAHIFSLISLYPLPQYVIVLEDDSKTHLVPIWIGVNEGNAIALEMSGERYPRPLTHDLFVGVLGEMGVNIDKIVIADLKENTYFARIFLTLNGNTHEIDARPSDSLAIAVRAKCPIYVEETVLEKCPVIDKPLSQDDVDSFKDDLKTMSPEEFFRKLESTPGKKKELDNIFDLRPEDDDPEQVSEDEPE